jgi:hypothetical protein
MFEELCQFAEAAATRVSRRQFLGRLGRGALTAAAALGGLLAIPSTAQAAGKRKVCWELSMVGECRGKPLNSPCTTGDLGPGRCWGTYEVAPHVFDCNGCLPKGRTE